MQSRMETILSAFRQQEDYMEGRIQRGIQEHRMDYAYLRFVDKEGHPLPHVQVEVKQISHDFKFGANLFMLGEYEDPHSNEAYQDAFCKLFNHATLPIYWKDLEPEPGKVRFSKNSLKVYRRPPLDLAVEFCEQHQIIPKAHCLVYDTWMPDWVPREVPAIKRLYAKRMEELASRYQHRIPDWEVINETLFVNGISPFYWEPDYLDWSFQEAARCFPHNHLLINDAHCNIWNVFNYSRSQYYMLIEGLLGRGVRIDGIGMQFHMFYSRDEEEAATKLFYNPRHLYNVMDCYGQFHRPVQISEVTIPAYSEEAGDEAVQAEIVRHLYRIWFSHSNTESIVWWNLADGSAYGAENSYYGGLLRADFTPKPAYEVLQHLIHGEWTSCATLDTGDMAEASFHGFFGRYSLTVTCRGKQFTENIHLQKKGPREFTIVCD